MEVSSWFVDTAALAAVVIAVTAFVKEHFLRDARDLVIIGVSIASGALLGVAGHFLGYVDGGVVPALAFGVSAGFLASGGWDAFKGIAGKA